MGAAAVYLNGTGTGTLTAATNLTDLDNSTLASMTVSTAASSIKTGDVLVLQATGGDVTLNLANNTTANQIVSVGSQKFNVTIAADSGNQVLTIASVNDASSGTTVDAAEAATVAEFDAVLDALKFNNTENASPTVGDRVFAVSANDGTNAGCGSDSNGYCCSDR